MIEKGTWVLYGEAVWNKFEDAGKSGLLGRVSALPLF